MKAALRLGCMDGGDCQWSAFPLKDIRPIVVVITVKRKFQAASYVSGGQDYARLFNQINADRSGEMTFEQFRAAVRRHGESPPTT